MWLLGAGSLSAAAALAHLLCIAGGPSWYRWFGAGDRLVRLAEQGSAIPAMVTAAITAILGIWALYAFSGAGLIGKLPLLRPVLVLVTAVYLLRACALPLLFSVMPDRTPTFLIWSSAIVLLIGSVHAIGLVTSWNRL